MAETFRQYTVPREHLVRAILDEARNSAGFIVTEGPELTTMSLDMGKGGDIQYLLDKVFYQTIKQELEEIKKIKAARPQKGN